MLTEEIVSRGHKCDFLPKFHCELNPIERVWAKSKWYIRSWSDQTAATLKKLIPKSFLSVNLTHENITNFFNKAKEYALRYLAGDSLLLAKVAVKKKSHRTVPPSEAHL